MSLEKKQEKLDPEDQQTESLKVKTKLKESESNESVEFTLVNTTDAPN
jgi:hypothetical protein